MKPVGFVSSFSASSKQYSQSRSGLSQYHLGRPKPEMLNLSSRQLDRNIYKTPDKKNAAGISAGAAGAAIGYSTPSLECPHRKQEQENQNDANDRELAIRKRNYLHYTADHVRLQRNSSTYVDMSQAISISARPADVSNRDATRSKDNQHRGAHISPSRHINNSYSGFISRSMNSSFLQRQAHSSINNSYHHPAGNHTNLLSDSMISDCSPPKSRLNQSSVISTTEWQIAPTEAYKKTDNDQKNSWNTCDYSLSANKATECTDFSMLRVSANPDRRLCFSESKSNSNYSLSQPENAEHTKEEKALSQADKNSKESIQIINQAVQEKSEQTKTDDVFKSIHIDAKAALALLESLDTSSQSSKKLSCLSYNDSSSWRKCQNVTVRQEDSILKSSDTTKSILRNQRESLRTAAPEGIITAITEQLKANCISLENSQMSSKAAPQASIVHVSSQEDKSNFSQPSASEQQQPLSQTVQSPSLPSFEQQVSPAPQDKQSSIKKDLSALQILQQQQQLQTQEKYSNDRQRAIQERIRRVEEITKKYSHLYQKDNENKNKKKDTIECIESDAIINNKDKQEMTSMQQEQQQCQEQVCQQTLEVACENTSTPRFPTIPGITYFTSAEEIRVFSASKNNANNTNDKSKETLQTKEEEQQ